MAQHTHTNPAVTGQAPDACSELHQLSSAEDNPLGAYLLCGHCKIPLSPATAGVVSYLWGRRGLK